MKNNYQFLAAIFFLFISGHMALAQLDLDEKGFSFQGYARNIDGAALSSVNIEVQFTIYPDGGAAAYVESHTSVATDAYGVFHVVIGEGTPTTGTYEGLDFANNNDYFLKVETKVVGGTFATISDAEMQSVPYAQVADNGVPVGSIIIFGGPKTNVPDGWIECDGRAVSSTNYPKLHAAIGTAWGDGSTGTGSGDFNLPDLRGVFVRGVDSGVGKDPDATVRVGIRDGGNTGDQVGSYQSHAFEDHQHDVDPPLWSTDTQGNHSHTQRLGNGGHGSTGLPDFSDTIGENGTTTTEVAGAHNHNFDIPSFSSDYANSGNHETETRPVNAYVWYIIRAR